VFITPEELFELIVMFVRSTNLATIFQTMMNKILRDLTNTGDIMSFIDNIIVEIEKEEEHDKIVEKVVKRLENNLYIKPEKFKWKVREVRFLGVVIGLDRIKMEEEKIKIVLKWLVFKRVKNIQRFLRLANYYWQFIKDFVKPLHKLVRKE